jgi:hypothetical protein
MIFKKMLVKLAKMNNENVTNPHSRETRVTKTMTKYLL